MKFVVIIIAALTVLASCHRDVAPKDDPYPEAVERWFVEDGLPRVERLERLKVVEGGPPRWGPLEPGVHYMTIRVCAEINETGHLVTLAVDLPPALADAVGIETWLMDNYARQWPVTAGAKK